MGLALGLVFGFALVRGLSLGLVLVLVPASVDVLGHGLALLILAEESEGLILATLKATVTGFLWRACGSPVSAKAGNPIRERKTYYTNIYIYVCLYLVLHKHIIAYTYMHIYMYTYT